MSSQLIFEMRRQRGQAIAPGLETMPTGIVMRAGGETDVDIRADEVTPELEAAITAAGMQIIESAPAHRTILARGTLDQIEQVAALTAVRSVRPPVPAVTRRLPRVRATGTVVSRGKQIISVEGKIEDSEGRILAHGTSTLMVFTPRG